jgi:STE24 endopeptidase
MTLGGGLAAIIAWTETIAIGPLWRDVLMFAVAGIVYGLVNLPFSWWHTFRIEERFGFNRMTLGLWLADLAKGLAVAVVLGLPLLLLILWLMRAAGTLWWLWAWGAWMVFQVLILVLYPTLIAPLFNKFTPMGESPARQRVEALLARCVQGRRTVRDGRIKRSATATRISPASARPSASCSSIRCSRGSPRGDRSGIGARARPLQAEARRHAHRMVGGIVARHSRAAGIPRARAMVLRRLGIPEAMLPVAFARPGIALELFLLALPVFTSCSSRVVAASGTNSRPTPATAVGGGWIGAGQVTRTTRQRHAGSADSAFCHDSHPPAAIRIAHIEALAASTAGGAA